MSQLKFIRHAQASFGKANYDQLSDFGFKQSALLGQYLVKEKQHFDRIYVGPLRRQRETYETVKAEYDKAGLSIPAPQFLDGLAEHRGPEVLRSVKEKLIEKYDHVKEWHEDTLRNPENNIRNHFKMFNFFMMNWATKNLNIDLPPHQDWQQFKSSVKEALLQIMEESGRGVTVGAFTSGGTISAITGYALEMKNEARIIEMNDAVINTSISDFKYAAGRLSMRQFNRVPHLNQEMITYV